MTKKTISAVVSIFATTTLLAATETVVKPAGDGANTITQEIDLETGNIVSERMTCVHVAPKANAETIKVLRLEVHSNGDAETAYVVGVDGVKRPVVLVTPDEFDLLTERLDKVWARMHEDKAGRKILHGAITNTVLDHRKMEMREYHKDGYIHTEPLIKKRNAVVDNKPSIVNGRGYPMPNPKSMSERQFEMRQRLWERRKHPVKEVSVEHDATTGTDRIVK